MKKSNSQTIVVLTGDSVIDDGSVVIEQEAESEEQSGESVIKHSTPVAVRVKKQDLSEEVSRPTRGAAAEAEEAAAVVEAEMVDAAEPEHDEGDQEVVSTKPTRGRATRASAVSKVEETDAGDEDGSSPTRKSTRARK